MSKHAKRLVSLCFTHGSSNLATLGPDSVILSSRAGNTIASLRQKSLGCLFMGKIVPLQILSSDNKLLDAVAVPAYFNEALTQKSKADKLRRELTTGYKIIILIADKHVVESSDFGRDYSSYVLTNTYGCTVLDLPASDNDSFIDVLYSPPTTAAPFLTCFYASGFAVSLSLDRSAVSISDVAAPSESKYGAITWQRTERFVTHSLASHVTFLEELNQFYGIVDSALSNSSYAGNILRGCTPCRAISLLTRVPLSSRLVLPYEKGFSMVDPLSAQAEAVFVEPGVYGPSISSYPTNFAMSSVDGGVIAVAFASGDTLVILNRSISMCVRSIQPEPVGVEYCFSEESSSIYLEKPCTPEQAGDFEGKPLNSLEVGNVPLDRDFNTEAFNAVNVLLLTGPKVATVHTLYMSRYSTARVLRMAGNIALESEPSLMAIGSRSLGYLGKNKLYWSELHQDATGRVILTWKTVPLSGNIKELHMVETEGFVAPCVRLSDGSVELYTEDSSSKALSFGKGFKVQAFACCSSFVYALSTQGDLCVLLCSRAEGGSAEIAQVASTSLGKLFEGTTGASAGDARLCVSPGGTCVVVYRVGQPSRPVVFLPAEGLLVQSGFSENLSVVDCVFDSALPNTFVLSLGTAAPEGQPSLCSEMRTCSLVTSVCDHEGPAILVSRGTLSDTPSPVGDRTAQAPPLAVTAGVIYSVTSDSIKTSGAVPGLSNLATCVSSIGSSDAADAYSAGLSVEPPRASSGAAPPADFCEYIGDTNALLPVAVSPVSGNVYRGQADSVALTVTGLFPQYRPLPHPSLVTSFERAVVELCSLGLTAPAFGFAARLGSPGLLKLLGDCALRYCDFDTARLCYNEVSVYQLETPSVSLAPPAAAATAAALGGLQANPIVCNMARGNAIHDNNPATLSLFLTRVCSTETDLNTSMALSLLLACPDLRAGAGAGVGTSTDVGAGANTAAAATVAGGEAGRTLAADSADDFLDAAERLLMHANRPGLALSFRIDSLDWTTASLLARRISSPFVRSAILVQWGGSLEARGEHQAAVDVCLSLARDETGGPAAGPPVGTGTGAAADKVSFQAVPSAVLPYLLGILGRCYSQLGRVQEARELVLPPRRPEDGKYVPPSRDPLNVLQRARLCFECAEVFYRQKRYAEAASFYEATAHLAAGCFARLSKEIGLIAVGELSLYDLVYGSDARVTGGISASRLLLFALVPALRAKAETALLALNRADGRSEAEHASLMDIDLLREIDATLSNDRSRAAVQGALPQRLDDVVGAADLAELHPPALLTKAAGAFIRAHLYADAERLIGYVTDKQTIVDLARVFMRDQPEKSLALFKRAGRSREIVDCLIALGKLPEAESATREVKALLDQAVARRDAGKPVVGGAAAQSAAIYDLESELRHSALALAAHYRRAGSAKKAVYFYVLGEDYDDAFELAVASGNEPVLVRFVEKRAPLAFLRKAAKHFASPDPAARTDAGAGAGVGVGEDDADAERRRPRNIEAAAKFLQLSGSADAAVKLLLVYGNGSTDIDRAIELLSSCRHMVEFVLKFLQGSADGVKKSPVYIIKLYMALERYADAAHTAYVLADREIEKARYSRAKGLLLQTMGRLRAQCGRVPVRFRDLLVLLHAVEAGRVFARQGLHFQAGVCLYRASRVASRFGESAASILLSACVECSRSAPAHRREAYECASTLLKEYDAMIPEKYRKAVETIVRKHKKGGDADQDGGAGAIPCCSCGEDNRPGVLSCAECLAVLPLDSATGSQMALTDYCECPYCAWTCGKLGYFDLSSNDAMTEGVVSCMMCGQQIDIKNALTVDAENYETLTSGSFSYSEYDVRPLLVFEDARISRLRYGDWLKIWHDEDIVSSARKE